MTNFILEKKFYDTEHYPHGFNRSGDYTKSESEVLEIYGTRLSRLQNQEVEPETPDEEHFLEVVSDPDLAHSFVEKTWVKYQNLISSVHDYVTLHNEIEEDVPASTEE